MYDGFQYSRIEENKDLPFDFTDNQLITLTRKIVNIRISSIMLFNLEHDKYNFYNLDAVINMISNEEITPDNIVRVSFIINLFENNNEVIPTMRMVCVILGYNPSYFEEITNDYIADVCDEIDEIIYSHTGFESLDDFLNDIHYMRFNDISDLMNLSYTIESKKKTLFDLLNEIDLKHYVKNFYEEVGMLLHKFASFDMLYNNDYKEIKYNDECIGKGVKTLTGVTVFFDSGKSFTQWINSDNQNKVNNIKEGVIMKNNNLVFDDGYVSTITKNGKIMYYYVDDNGKKKRISESEALSHAHYVDEDNDDISDEITEENIEDIETEESEEEQVNGDDNVNVTAGDKSRYIYFELHMTENSIRGDIISLACVNYDGKNFYAEFDDFKKTDNTDSDVLDKLSNPATLLEGNNWSIVDVRDGVKTALLKWIDEINPDKRPIQFVSDKAHLKFTMLLDLLGDDKPDFISSVCLDLNQDIATSITRYNSDSSISEDEFNKDFVPLMEATRVDRFNYVNTVEELSRFRTVQSNAMVGAMIIKVIHQFLWNLH